MIFNAKSYTINAVRDLEGTIGIKRDILYYDFIEYKDYYYLVAATNRGLAFVSSRDNQFYEFSSFYPQKMLIKDAAKIKPYVTQIKEYLEHKRKKFTIPIELFSTTRALVYTVAVEKCMRT